MHKVRCRSKQLCRCSILWNGMLSAWYFPTSVFLGRLLFLFLQAKYHREGHSYCSSQGCERVKIQASFQSKSYSNCSANAYPKYFQKPTAVKRMPTKITNACQKCGSDQVRNYCRGKIICTYWMVYPMAIYQVGRWVAERIEYISQGKYVWEPVKHSSQNCCLCLVELAKKYFLNMKFIFCPSCIKWLWVLYSIKTLRNIKIIKQQSR